jgi:hypothetical protein
MADLDIRFQLIVRKHRAKTKSLEFCFNMCPHKTRLNSNGRGSFPVFTGANPAATFNVETLFKP